MGRQVNLKEKTHMKNKCVKCQSPTMEGLFDYTINLLGQDVVISKVEGRKCRECGHLQIDKAIEKRLKTKILEKKLEIRRRLAIKPLLISSVKSVRLDEGLAQKKAGEALGFSEQRFGAIERNDNTPTIFLALQIADVLNTDINQIYKIEYINEELFNELRHMNEDFEIIKELVSLREELTEVDNRLDEILKDLKLNKKGHGENLSREIEEKMTKLTKEQKTLKSKKMVLLKKIEPYEKKAILKQGYCLDYDKWIEVQERFKDKLGRVEF